jgi:diguanylate cyclase (GGDEF)-like protein/PAS domain S-box-containing protein
MPLLLTKLEGVILLDRNQSKSSEQINIEQQLREIEERYRILFEYAEDMIYTRTISGKFTSVNGACERILGYSKEQLLNMSIYDISDSEEHQGIYNLEHFEDLNLSQPIKLDIKFITSKNENITVELIRSVIRKSDGSYEILVIGRDITERLEYEDAIAYLSFHDKLTGLYNRAFFEMKVNHLSKEFILPLSLIMADVNGLKLVNDAFGHLDGDKLLKKVSVILSSAANSKSLVFRLGGDEFVILTPGASQESVREIISNIKKGCNEECELTIKPSVAIGYSLMTSYKQTIDEIIKEAENMMYTNKLVESKSFRNSIISSLQKTMKESTPDISEHSTRVKVLAREFGRLLNMSQEKIDKLVLLALLHDIGKIAISADILLKSDTLTEDEEKAVRNHCKIGYNIANSTPELSSISELILYHHERWDGKGYPHGLKGNDIPELSRIISIIDAFDSITHGISYRSIVQVDKALLELRNGAGSRFDPDLVEKFIGMINEKCERTY